ncbi:MAG: hypothetical protein ABIL09_11040 [Gemmatimonadota bacterium]
MATTSDIVELTALRGLSPRQARLLTLDAIAQGTIYAEAGLLPWELDTDEHGQYVAARQRAPGVQAGLAGASVQKLLDKLVGARVFPSIVLSDGTDATYPPDVEAVDDALWQEGIDLSSALYNPAHDLVVKGSGALGFTHSGPGVWEAAPLRTEWCDVVFVSQVTGSRARSYAAQIAKFAPEQVGFDDSGPLLVAPTVARSLDVAFLRYQYRWEEEVPRGGRTATETVIHWLRRDYLPNAILEYLPVEVHSDTEVPQEFFPIPTEPHNWGVVPVVWITPRGTDPGVMDGPSLLTEPVKKVCQAADYEESFAHNAFKVNAAPEKDEIDVRDRAEGEAVMGGDSNAYLKPADAGAINRYQSIGEHPAVQLLETSGVALTKGLERAQHFAQLVAKLTGIVDYDQSQASGTISGTALKRMADPLLSRVDGYRGRLGPALQLFVQKLATAMRAEGEISSAVSCEAEWPDVIELTAEDISALATAYGMLRQHSLISPETAIVAIGNALGLADPEGEVGKVQAYEQEAMRRAMETMQATGGVDPDPTADDTDAQS